MHNTGGGGNGETGWIWVRKNGVDVANTTTDISVIPNSPFVVAAWNFVFPINSGDYYEIMWSTDNKNIQIEYIPPTSFAPGTPSAIVTVTPVSNVLQGSQGAQGVQGSTGTTGAQGAQGSQGTIGAQGDVGPNYQNAYNQANTATTLAQASFNYANTAITTSGGSITGRMNVTHTPATTIGTALTITGANTVGGTGYADVLKFTNTSAGATFPNKTIRLNNTGGLEMIDSNYGNNIFWISDAGDVTIKGNTTSNGIGAGYAPNRPAFRVSGNGGSISATTTVAGGYMVVDYNQGSYLNTTTGIFTAPVAGLYQVNIVVRTQSNNNSGINQIIIKKTSGVTTITAIMVEFGPNTSMNHTGGSTIIKMAAGDTLKFDVTAGTISFDGNDNWSVAYIG